MMTCSGRFTDLGDDKSTFSHRSRFLPTIYKQYCSGYEIRWTSDNISDKYLIPSLDYTYCI